jgi:radical SAM protein with 4Fe4S-binding SPASM domain
MSHLRVIEFQLLQDCNARCLYCAYNQDYAPYDGFLPLSLISRTLKEMRPEWVWFEGGEVTMSEESRAYLHEAITIAHSLGVRNRINTNAQRCDPGWSGKLARAGLRFACVSFDSLDPACFATLRGFHPDKAETLLQELITNTIGLLDAGITVDIEATLTRYNITELISLYDFCENLPYPPGKVIMGVQCLVATYDELFELYPSFHQIYDALSALTKRAQNGSIPVRICCSPLVPCRYPDLYIPHPNVWWVGCSCGYDYVHIHANGDVFLCGFWDHGQPMGNLHENSLKEIWETSQLRQKAIMTIPSGCRGCKDWEGGIRCHNTCFSILYRKTGSFDGHAYTLTAEQIEQVKVNKQ